jgi:hypothetical protein
LKIVYYNLISIYVWNTVIALGCVAARSPHKPTEGPRRALVTIEGMDISGKLMVEQASFTSPVKIRGVIYGLEPGRHGLHVHAGTTLGNQCESVGPQFNPAEKYESERSVSYIGNIKVNIIHHILFFWK